MILTINFKHKDGKENTLKVDNAEYCPNIGENVHNEQRGVCYFRVSTKDIYYNLGSHTHVVIIANEV